MTIYDTAGRPKISFTPQLAYGIKGATFASQVPLSPGVADAYVYCPVACIITGVRLLTSGGTGSCVVGVSAAAFGSFPPTYPTNSIDASDPPTISAGTDYSDNTLSGWTTAIAAGTVLGFHLVSSGVFTNITCQLLVSQQN